MKLSKAWASYDDYSRTASNNARRLAFALAAVAWIFFTDEPTHSKWLVGSLAFVIIFFVLDLAQYVLGAERVRQHTASEEDEQGITAETDLDTVFISWPRSLDRPVLILYVMKLFILAAASLSLLPEFLFRLE